MVAMDRLTPDECSRVEESLGLVHMVVNEYVALCRVKPDSKDDAVAAGVCGLARAVRYYDPEKEWAFSTVAVRQIKNEIARDPLIGHVRRNAKGHSSRFRAVSFDSKPWRISTDGSYTYQPTNDAADRLYDPFEDLLDVIEAEGIMDLMFLLVDHCYPDERRAEETRQILYGRFVEGDTIASIAEAVGYSPETIRSRIDKIIKELRWVVGGRGITTAEGFLLAERAIEDRKRLATREAEVLTLTAARRALVDKRRRERAEEMKRRRREARSRRRRTRRKALTIEALRDMAVGPRPSSVVAHNVGLARVHNLDIRFVRMAYTDLGVRWMVVRILPSGRFKRLGVVYVGAVGQRQQKRWTAVSSSGNLTVDGLADRYEATNAILIDHRLVKVPKPPKPPRKSSPRKGSGAKTLCGGCNHPLSFHPQEGRCVAFGCYCSSWQEDKIVWSTVSSLERDDPRRVKDFF